MEEMRKTMTKAAEDQTEFLEPLSMLYKQMVDQNDTDIIDISAGCVKHFDCVLVRFEAPRQSKPVLSHHKSNLLGESAAQLPFSPPYFSHAAAPTARCRHDRYQVPGGLVLPQFALGRDRRADS